MDELTQNTKAFVFVVCGAREHIDTLHLALKHIRQYTKYPIIILSDTSRNEINIEHDNLIDVRCPEIYNNHQASIYLKTGIHKFLPKHKHYCYLDTDIIALNEEINNIFNHYVPPITFAPDHCTVPIFSPYAVNCSCLTKNQTQVAELNALLNRFDPNRQFSEEQKEASKTLIALFNQKKKNKLSYLLIILRYLISRKIFTLNDFFLDKKTKIWYRAADKLPVLYDYKRIAKTIAAKSPYRWRSVLRAWQNAEGENVFNLRCDHLTESISEDFNIRVSNKNWQHWNGGVFLFDDQSEDFLNGWHDKSLQAFDLPNWKTRDQGTLIATAWEFGLDKHKTLDKKWNFLADYYKEGIDFNEKGEFTDDYWNTSQKVNFIHIYHHWGDESWPLWNWVTAQRK